MCCAIMGCLLILFGQEREFEVSPKEDIQLDADVVEDINAARLIVRNLNEIVDDGRLFRFFSPFGEIVSHKVLQGSVCNSAK